MMNEQQEVLKFFALEENLPLTLVTAEHLDAIRLRLNNEFWLALRKRLEPWLKQQTLPWSVEITEDRNNEECLVGLHLQPSIEYRMFLRPFMEQQLLGDNYRIFYGLMWNNPPDAALKTLPDVEALNAALNKRGFKQGDTFLAWQWLPWHPRRRDFLLRLHSDREELLDDVMRPWLTLLAEYGELLGFANHALNAGPRHAVISLDKLHIRSKP